MLEVILMLKRFLFLDIDGVVNTHMIYSSPIEGRRLVKKMVFILIYVGQKMVECLTYMLLDG